jgi:hypothetical protein
MRKIAPLVIATLASCSHEFSNPIEAGPTGSIRGTLVQHADDEDTLPVSGAVCTLEGTNRSAETDAVGFFNIVSVEDGSYILICRSDDELGNPVTVLQVVEVKNGVAVDLGVLIATRPGALQGTARLQERTTHGGVRIEIPGTSLAASTDDDGRFELTSVPEGSYTLRFSADGYLDVDLTSVDVYASETTQIEPVTLPLSTGPSGTILLDGGSDIALTRSITVSVVASDAAVRMMLSTSSTFVDADWRAVAGLVPWAFSSDGEKTLYARFSDANGLESAPVEDHIIVDTLPPTGGVVINNDALVAGTSDVVLSLFAEDEGAGVTEMQLSNDPTFAGATWSAFTAFREWSLEPGEGTRRVYARFRDGAGRISSDAAEDDIEVDTSSPVGGIWFAEGPYTRTNNVTLLAAATGAVQMRISRDAELSSPVLQAYSASTPLYLVPVGSPVEDGTYGVWVEFIDGSGNAAEPVTASIILDATAPTLPQLLGSAPTPTNELTVFIPFAAASIDASPITYLYAFDGTEPTWVEGTIEERDEHTGIVIALPDVADGELNVLITVRDAAGNVPRDGLGQIARRAAPVLLDRVAPSLGTVDLFLEREVTNGYSFVVRSTGFVSDPCTLHYGASSTSEASLPFPSSPQELLTLVLQPMSSYLIEATCADAAGNSWASGARRIETGSLLGTTITSNTTLSSANGPLWVDYVMVSDGVTLTLAPGTWLRGIHHEGASTLTIGGEMFDVVAEGTEEEPIRLEDVTILSYAAGTYRHIEAVTRRYSPGVYARDLVVEDSRFAGGTVEAGFSITAGANVCVVRRNVFSGYAAVGTTRCDSATVENNRFQQTVYPLAISPATVVVRNTLNTVDVSGDGAGVTVMLGGNDWGTTSVTEIMDNRLDLTDAPGATVDLQPLLSAPDASTPGPWTPSW